MNPVVAGLKPEDFDSKLEETDLKFGAFESFEMILGQKSASGSQYFVSNMKNQ